MSKSISLSLRDYSKRMLSLNSYLQAQGKETLYYAGKLLGAKEFAEESSADLENALVKISNTYVRFSESTLKVGRLGADFLAAELHGCPTCVEAEYDGRTHCWMDAGYIAGALETMLGKRFVAIETKCRGTGHEYCEFVVTEDRSTKVKRRTSTAFERFETSPM
jgi:predicted hydrocarbon binding protein